MFPLTSGKIFSRVPLQLQAWGLELLTILAFSALAIIGIDMDIYKLIHVCLQNKLSRRIHFSILMILKI